MLKKDDARKRIYSIWSEQDNRCSKEPGYPLDFYSLIKNNHNELLSFRSAGDKYQVIAAWVNEWQRDHC